MIFNLMNEDQGIFFIKLYLGRWLGTRSVVERTPGTRGLPYFPQMVSGGAKTLVGFPVREA